MSFIIGKKLKMSQVWKENTVIPVTVIKVLPNKVTTVRTKRRDSYDAVQVSSSTKRKEFRVKEATELKMGDIITVEAFKENDTVRVSGYAKGRGFQGVVKRHGFGGGPKTHGQKNRYRAPGSIGSTAPQRVWPGRRMAGRMGNNRVTVKNLEVVAVDPAESTISIKGAVPGARGGFIEIRKI